MEELQVIETTSGRQFKPWASREDVQAIKQETVQAVVQAVQDPASITAITSEIASGKQAIASAINAKGGTASATETFTELAEAVEEIPNYSDMIKLAGIIAGGNYNKNALQGHNENVKYGKTEIIDNVVAFEKINVPCCFQYWDLLGKVTLPSLTTISGGGNEFYNCIALQKVDMPSLTTISGGNTFANCSALQKVDMPSLTTIINCGNTFANCSALQKVDMPSLTTINGGSTFYNCSALQKVDMPSLTTISGGNTFYNCSALQKVDMPSLTTISGGNTFYNCIALQNVTFGVLTGINEPFYNIKPNLRNITIGQDTDVNLPFQSWTATNVIAEGQSGIDELNSNLYNNLLTKLYDHSQDGQTRTLRIGWLANVTAENIAYANAKGWTLTT